MAQSNSTKWPLHYAVFQGDHDTVKRLLNSGFNVAETDPHGNTALHIAVAIGCESCCSALIERDSPVGQKNKYGWHTLHEAVSYGQRPMITKLAQKLKEQARRKMEIERPRTLQIVGQLPDFQLTVNWEFSSWLPFVNRVMPNDVCKLYKKGSRIRVDSTLLDFQEAHWEHGDITFLFNKEGRYARGTCNDSEAEVSSTDEEFDEFLYILDNRRQQFQRLRKRETLKALEEEVSGLMSSDVVSAHLRFDTSRIERERRGTSIFSSSSASYRHTVVGDYEADYYEIHGLVIEARKRREHLTDVEVQRNKEIISRLAQRGDFTNVKSIVRQKASLEPPLRTVFDFDVYCNSAPSLHDVDNDDASQFSSSSECSQSQSQSQSQSNNKSNSSRTRHSDACVLGRPHKQKVQRKHVHARVAMSTDFPLSVPEFVLVLDVVAPYKKFNHLREFLLHRLPPGFPVKLDIPVYPTVNAKVVFKDFAFERDKAIPDSLFELPVGYSENPRLFPGV